MPRAALWRDEPTGRQASGAACAWRRVAALILAALRRLRPRAWRAARTSVADVAEGLQDSVVNISTTQTLKGTAEGAPNGPGPKGSPFEEFFDDFFDEDDADGLPRKVQLARLGLRHRSVGSRGHQQPRHRGRRRDHHQLHRRHQAEGRQDPRPRSEDRSRFAESRAQEAAQGGQLRRLFRDAGRRLGDGDRQSVRPWRQRHRRHHLRHQARHQCRPL